MHEIAARAKPGRPAHPGQHDIRPPLRDLAAKREPGAEVERAAEPQLGQRHPGVAQTLRACAIAADQHPLRLAGALQRRRQPHEKRFGPAVARPGDRLQQPASHRIKASKCPATASQLNPR